MTKKSKGNLQAWWYWPWPWWLVEQSFLPLVSSHSITLSVARQFPSQYPHFFVGGWGRLGRRQALLCHWSICFFRVTWLNPNFMKTKPKPKPASSSPHPVGVHCTALSKDWERKLKFAFIFGGRQMYYDELWHYGITLLCKFKTSFLDLNINTLFMGTRLEKESQVILQSELLSTDILQSMTQRNTVSVFDCAR